MRDDASRLSKRLVRRRFSLVLRQGRGVDEVQYLEALLGNAMDDADGRSSRAE
jgi:hypothetical protein